MRRSAKLLAVLCLSLLSLAGISTAARATVVTETYTFSLNNFADVGATVAPPIKSIIGSFTLTFDPSLTYSNDTTDIVVNYLSDTMVSSPIGFDNTPSTGPGVPDFLAIGGILNDADFIAFGTDDIAINLKFFNPSAVQFALCSDGYGCGTAPGSTVASGYTLTGFPDSAWLPAAGVVPEPTTWVMMLLGFGAIGLVRRRVGGQVLAA